MTKPQVEVVGGKELRKALKAAGTGVQDLKDAHAKAASIVSGAAQPLTPFRTGRLRDSIRGAGQAAGAVVRAGGARVPYAGPIHWGWPARNIEAQPFLSDAAQDTEPTWLPVYEADVQRIIDDAVAREAKTS